jgi:Flp pilus assembly protein TadD
MKRLCLLSLVAAALGCASTANRAPDEGALRARKQLTRELVARGDWANAFSYADELHRERPDDAEILTLRGIVYRERNLPGEAEADLRAALTSDERNAAAHAALGILLDATGRSAEAETHHRRAVALDGHNPGYLNNLGFSLLVRRQPRQAVEVLQRAARLDPTHHRIRTNLGFAYAAAGDLPRAAREFEMGGTPAEAKTNLGFAYQHRGDDGNAFELYVAALRLDPACRRARSNLGQLAGRLGREIPADVAGPAPPSPPVTVKEVTP